MSALGQNNPLDNPAIWDFVTIAGVNSPGVIKDGALSEWKRQHEWDVKKGKGTVGATITFTSKPPAEGSITWYLWLPEHFAAWDDFLPLLQYDPTKKQAQAVDIYHPALDAIDVHSVVTTKIGNVMYEGKGLYSITVDFLEYFPAPNQNATGTPTGDFHDTSTQKAGSGPPKAQTEEEKQIQQLWKTAQAA